MTTTSTNPFANYTLSIAAQYDETSVAIKKAQQKPRRKVYRSLDKMLEECFFMGAGWIGNNYIA